MTRLDQLRRKLQSLRAARSRVRWTAALAGWLLATLACLAVVFLLDWSFTLDRYQRIGLEAVALGVIVWSAARCFGPALATRESLLDMALLVEKIHKIDSDLVGAIQFEDARKQSDSRHWGSNELREAVVGYVSEWKDLDVYKGHTAQPATRRLIPLVGSVAVVVGLAVLYPTYAEVFFQRLLLSDRHYPTRTEIAAVSINGKPVSWEVGAAAPKSPYGRVVKFAVTAQGEVPESGYLQVVSEQGGRPAVIPLTLASAGAPEATSGTAGQKVLLGELARLVEPVEYQVFLGDAWTDPAALEVVPLPTLDVALTPHAPPYAALAVTPEDAPPGSRNIAVVEGSRIDAAVSSSKPLAQCTAVVGKETFALVKTDADGKAWSFDAKTSPFADVREAVRFEIQAEDVDGLTLEQPILGYIRIKADREPRVTTAMITRVVLPTAKPSLGYGAIDDYGLAKLRLHREIVHEGREPREDVIEIPVDAKHPKLLKQDKYSVDLASLGLEKGDQVRIVLEAVDFRGDREGKSSFSEPLVLQVTDQRGVLEALDEGLERSAEHLDAIIMRQLGIGESR
ncbi:MAG TPA: hypothetical protein VGE52_13800 [Pirellulales bacterium]